MGRWVSLGIGCFCLYDRTYIGVPKKVWPWGPAFGPGLLVPQPKQRYPMIALVPHKTCGAPLSWATNMLFLVGYGQDDFWVSGAYLHICPVMYTLQRCRAKVGL
jgi:hypothetical protein